MVNKFYKDINEQERLNRPQPRMELVRDRFLKVKGYKYSESDFLELIEKLDHKTEAKIIRENYRDYVNRNYVTMPITSLNTFLQGLYSFGGFKEEKEFENQLKNLSKYVSHVKYYNRLPFKTEEETDKFFSSLKIMTNQFETRFYVYRRVVDTYKELADDVYALNKEGKLVSNNFLHALELVRVVTEKNVLRESQFNHEPLLKDLKIKLNKHKSGLDFSSISALLSINSRNELLGDKDFQNIDKRLKEILSNDKMKVNKNELLKVIKFLKKAGKLDTSQYLDGSLSFDRTEINNSEQLYTFLSNSAFMLEIDYKVDELISIVNETIQSNTGLLRVNMVDSIIVFLRDSRVPEKTKTILKDTLSSMLKQNNKIYNLKNHEIQEILNDQVN